MPQKLVIAAGVVVAALGAVVTALYRRDLRVARNRLATGSLLADTESGPVEYAEKGEGMPLLVVHGAGGGFDQGMTIGEDLARQGVRVIAMSRFGYLRTPIPGNASAEAQADAHLSLMDALGIEKAAVMGVSAGAPSATQLAIRHPDRINALVLVVPAIYALRPGNAPSLRSPPATQFLFSTALRSDFLFWAGRHVARRALVRGILGTPPEDLDNVSPAEHARVERILDEILPVSQRRRGMLNDASIVWNIPRYELEKISVPTLCISVADDLFGTFAGARYTSGEIRDARFIAYATGGHILAGHQTDLVSQITEFLSSLETPSPALRPEVEAALRPARQTADASRERSLQPL